MKAKVLIVDGHSMIFQWPELAAKHRSNRLAAREELVRVLTGLQDGSDWHVVVVFDGRQARAGEASEPGGIRIFYSANGQTADSVIERLVAKYSGTYDVTVATDDHLERTTVQSFGGRAMSSLQLRDEVELADADLAGRIKRLGRSSGKR